MVSSENVNTERMNTSLELSLGHAVLSGVMSAEEAYEYLEAYETALNPGEIGSVIAEPSYRPEDLPPAVSHPETVSTAPTAITSNGITRKKSHLTVPVVFPAGTDAA